MTASASLISATAGTHGGGIYFENTGTSTLSISASTITTLRANGFGGLAYFGGTDNTATITSATTVISDVT